MSLARPGPAEILFVELSPFRSYGGTKRVVVSLASGLDRARFRPRVVCFQHGPWEADLAAADVPVTVVEPVAPAPVAAEAGSPAGEAAAPRRSWRDALPPAVRHALSDANSLWGLWRHERAAARPLAALVPPGTRLIHVNHSMVNDQRWYHVARRCGVPFVTHEHGTWRRRPAAYRHVVRRAAAVLCLTEQRVGELRELLGPHVRAEHLPNGVPVDRLTPTRDRAAVRADLGVPEERLLIVTASHLQAWKGQTLAVEAASRLAAAGLHFTWLLCGEEVEPGSAAALEWRIAEAGVLGTVRYIGPRHDLPDLFAACDLAAHTSLLPEPFGLVVLEAMLQRLPVVGPREGAIPGLIRDGVDGRLVPPRDAAALAAALLELALAPERRRAMGEAARARVIESFDVRHQVRRLEAIYDRVLGAAGRGGA